MIVLVNDEGLRLCKDGKLRGLAFFGTGPSDVKLYKSQRGATQALNRFRTLRAVQLADTVEMDANGYLMDLGTRQRLGHVANVR